MAALAPEQQLQPVRLILGEHAVAAQVQDVAAPLDTSMEAVQLCNCHSLPVISAADLAHCEGAARPVTAATLIVHGFSQWFLINVRCPMSGTNTPKMRNASITVCS